MRWVTEILLRKFILEKPENLLEKSWNFEFIFCWPPCMGVYTGNHICLTDEVFPYVYDRNCYSSGELL